MTCVPCTIAIDVMSGDYGAATTVPAALDVLVSQPQLSMILVGDQDTIEQQLRQYDDHDVSALRSRIELVHSSQVVAMDDKPSLALRNKKDSSMRVAINLVKEQKAQACVSAGNTGALMATARFVLKMLPGIQRPAICTAIPTMKGHVHMLDLGANIDVSSDHLFEFAVMASVLAEVVDKVKNPSIGLLNIGEEELKGNDQIKEAAKQIANSPLNYYGFVEGDDIYKGTTDIVVCDGFVGNVALKTSEGVAKMIGHYLKQAYNRNWLTRLLAFLSLSILKSFKKQIDPGEYNGASLLGLRGIVVKSHGGAGRRAFAQAVRVALLEVEQNITLQLSQRIEELLLASQQNQVSGNSE